MENSLKWTFIKQNTRSNITTSKIATSNTATSNITTSAFTLLSQLNSSHNVRQWRLKNMDLSPINGYNQVCGYKWLGCHAGYQEFTRYHTRGDPEKFIAWRWQSMHTIGSTLTLKPRALSFEILKIKIFHSLIFVSATCEGFCGRGRGWCSCSASCLNGFWGFCCPICCPGFKQKCPEEAKKGKFQPRYLLVIKFTIHLSYRFHRCDFFFSLFHYQ